MQPDQGNQLVAEPSGGRPSAGWKRYLNQLLAREISTITKYFGRLIQWLPLDNDDLDLLDVIQSPSKGVVRRDHEFPDLSAEENERTAVLINGTFNHHFDIQGLLMELKPRLSRTSRLLVVFGPGWSLSK